MEAHSGATEQSGGDEWRTSRDTAFKWRPEGLGRRRGECGKQKRVPGKDVRRGIHNGIPMVAQMVKSLPEPEDPSSISESGRAPGEGNGYPPRYSCLENSIDRGAWQASVHEATKSQTRLNN